MKLTKEFLDHQHACSDGLSWFLEQEETDSLEVVKKLIKQEKMEWSNWLIVRVMNRPQYLSYAIYAAEQVIDIYEKEYPHDKRPRLAIEAAKDVLKNDTSAARAVARAAAWAAWDTWVAGGAGAAAWAARAAAWDWDAGTARAAAGAAWDAGAARAAGDAAKKEMQLNILKFGISLLEGI